MRWRRRRNASRAITRRRGRRGTARSSASPAPAARRPARQHAPPPRPRAAPPRQTEAPTLSPALKAQGWAVKQSRSTGGYYYVHTANGREWSQWEPPVAPVAPERRSSPERAAAALFSDEDDDGSASDSEDEMPVSALLARQATANDAAIAQALADSPPKRSRRITGGVGGRRHGSKKRREPVVVPAPAEDSDDSSSVWSQSSLSDSNPPSPTYESVMESGGIDYESGFLDDENPAPAGRGRGAVKPRRAWMTRGGAALGTLDARVDDDFRPFFGSRAVLAAAAPAPRPPPRPSAAVSTPRPWRNPYAAEAAATNAPRGWRNPYAAEAAATHVITPEGAPFGQAPRWAPPTPWGPPVLPVRTQSEPWTSRQWTFSRGPAFRPYGPGGYTPAPPGPGVHGRAAAALGGRSRCRPDGAEFSGDEGGVIRKAAAEPPAAAGRHHRAKNSAAGAVAPRVVVSRREVARPATPPKVAQSRGGQGRRAAARERPQRLARREGRRHLRLAAPRFLQEPRLYWSGGAEAQGSQAAPHRRELGPAPSRTAPHGTHDLAPPKPAAAITARRGGRRRAGAPRGAARPPSPNAKPARRGARLEDVARTRRAGAAVAQRARVRAAGF